MGTYQQILNILQKALEQSGGNRIKLMDELKARGNRTTLYRALEKENPVLPKPEILCSWLDELDVRIVDAFQEDLDCTNIPMTIPDDLRLEQKKRKYMGYCYFRDGDLDHDADYVGMNADADLQMPPTIRRGDLMLVDISASARAAQEEGAVHLLLLHDDAFALRRIQRAQGGMMLVSDVPEIAPVFVSDAGPCPYSVLGRVESVVKRRP